LAQRRTPTKIPQLHRDSDFRERARDLRHNLTNGEQLLWSRLRAHRMDGRKFRRQHVIGSYIVDFVCLKARLIVEVDGESHFEDGREAADAQRDADLASRGFKVLRFGNHNVLTNISDVAGAIAEELESAVIPAPRPSSEPSPQGEREKAF
jgi:5-methyltetrahydrofolate--homocysteine methyltransferase